MLCKRCNNLIPDDSTFCRYCGEKVAPEVVQTTNTAPVEYVPSKKKSHKVLIISIIVFFIALVVVGGIVVVGVMLPNLTNFVANNPETKEKLIKETVKQVKATEKLPSKLDDVTTWVDVTAQPDAIRYHYVLDGLDTSQLSNEFLKDYLRGALCNSQGSTLLKLDINMEYSYTVKGSQQKFFVVMTKDDCGF